MPWVTRGFDTDLGELAYQIQRSEAFLRLGEGFRSGAFDDQELQERLLDFLDQGRCRLQGDRGLEEWTWALSELECAQLAGRLFREAAGEA
jgi:hypothetical protein